MTYKLYIDMDQVLVDFDRGVFKTLGYYPQYYVEKHIHSKMVEEVEKLGKDFWINLEWTINGKKFWSLIEDYKPQPIILSSPGRFSKAIEGKNIWINKNINSSIPRIYSTEKWMYAESNTILIDDWNKNIEKWKKAGGIGILYKSASQAFFNLTKIINNTK